VKLTTTRDALARAAAWATATARVGNRPATPVLGGLLLAAGADGTVTAAGYDCEVSATATLAAEVGEPGRALIPARLLAQAAASLPAADEVTLTSDGTFATLAAGRVSYRLMLLPHEEFPAPPETGLPFAEFGAGYLAAAVAQAATAASTDDTLPALTCLHVSLDGGPAALAGKPAVAGVATIAATDRYRLAVVTCPYTTTGQAASRSPRREAALSRSRRPDGR
jgi:DNA polymerase-3 subunit beta